MSETAVTSDTSPLLTVVVCSLNGAQGVERVLAALDRQSIAPRLDVVLVDDGSRDGTAEVGRRHGARVIVHAHNRGLGAARNTGLGVVTTPVVAFLDDDCDPYPDWAERLVGAHADGTAAGVGGAVEPVGPPGYLTEYLRRHNPLRPLGRDLADGNGVAYRLMRYLAANWRAEEPQGRRTVFSLVGANMSFRVDALRAIGGFDDTMRFGSEDLDACMRMREKLGDDCLVFDPDVRVQHHFDGRLADTLRRSRAYGRGHARMLAKHGSMRPTLYPLPVATFGLVTLGLRRPAALAVAAILPHAIHPGGLRAVRSDGPSAILDAYVACLQEAAHDVGVAQGLLRVRRERSSIQPSAVTDGRH